MMINIDTKSVASERYILLAIKYIEEILRIFISLKKRRNI